jgi:hypothetical protein
MKTITTITLSLCFMLVHQALRAQGGSLTPPGPPGPTMTTLSGLSSQVSNTDNKVTDLQNSVASVQTAISALQTDPRTAIPKSPATPVFGPHYTISIPGSYYLTGNVEVTGGNGIAITTSDVTLDLNGFVLISKTANPAQGSAIDIAANLTNIEIKNGRISGGTVRTYLGPKAWNATFAAQGWLTGIKDGVGATNPSRNLIISNVTVEKCGGSGMQLHSGGVLQNVAATGNEVYGIYADHSTLVNVTVSNNGLEGVSCNYGTISCVTATANGDIGIDAYQGSVTNANASNNGAEGISADYGSVLNSTSSNNNDDGIHAIEGTVVNCRATTNFKSGIRVGLGVAAHCVAAFNSSDPATTDKEITVSVGGQRDACVPASE